MLDQAASLASQLPGRALPYVSAAVTRAASSSEDPSSIPEPMKESWRNQAARRRSASVGACPPVSEGNIAATSSHGGGQ